MKDIDAEEVEFIEDVTKDLSINQDNIFHIMLVGGTELVGEIIHPELKLDDNGEEVFAKKSDESSKDHDIKSYLICNPIKIVRENFLTEEGYLANNFFIEWNPCTDDPYADIKKSLVLSLSRPNHQTLYSYVRSIYEQYYPAAFEVEFEDDVYINEDIQMDADQELILQGLLATDASMLQSEPSSNIVEFLPYLRRKQQQEL